jgi:hypothetical protein
MFECIKYGAALSAPHHALAQYQGLTSDAESGTALRTARQGARMGLRIFSQGRGLYSNVGNSTTYPAANHSRALRKGQAFATPVRLASAVMPTGASTIPK